MAAAQYRILREDLAEFDASVRAWLSTADGVMYKQHKQFLLIVRNLTQLPRASGRTTYEKIINAWTSAMAGFESLLQGRPQTVTDNAVLVALSAWHLYPKLIVYAAEHKLVDFNDALFPVSAAVTVGLELSEQHDKAPGFRWSMALSHLKYYGHDVVVEVDTENVRITMEDLALIALGALFRRWNVKRSDEADALSALVLLQDLLEQSNYLEADGREELGWFIVITGAAKRLQETMGRADANAQRLVQYGRRRG